MDEAARALDARDQRRASVRRPTRSIVAMRPAAPAALARASREDEFAGHSFHSAEWDHDYDLRGKRVAVIGTGASAVQFVPPVAEQAAHARRLPAHGQLVPAAATTAPTRAASGALIERVPGAPAARRLRDVAVHGRRFVRSASRDPRTLGRGCCRAWSAAFMRCQLKDPRAAPQGLAGLHVRLQAGAVQLGLPARAPAPGRRAGDGPIERARARGRRHRATGASTRSTASSTAPASAPPTSCSRWRWRAPAGATLARGLGARRRTRTSGITVPGFPNMFVMYGPNTNTSGGSIIVYDRGAGGLHPPGDRLRAAAARPLDVRPEVEAASTARCRSGCAARRGRAATPGTATRAAAGSSPTGPASCASTCAPTRAIRPEEFREVRPRGGAA